MEGYWISPDGEYIPVVEHLIALQHEPQQFGLSQRQVKGQDIAGLKGLAEEMIREDGWIRYRFMGGTHYFEMGKLDKDTVETILFEGIENKPLMDERIYIEVAKPRREYTGTIDTFVDRSMFRTWENNPKAGWRFCC